MNPPNHLWSGDWEAHSNEPPVQPVQAAPAPELEPEPEPEPDGRRRRTRLTALGAIVALLVIVGVVLALTLPGGSHTSQRTTAFTPRPFNGNGTGGNAFQPSTTPQQTTTTPSTTTTTPAQTATVTQTPAPVQVGPSYTWLGMQLSATPNGIAVSTVTIGGAADAAGLNPGDVISQVNQTDIGSIAQLQAAVKDLKLGTQLQLTVDRGTTPVVISVTLSNRPKRQS